MPAAAHSLLPRGRPVFPTSCCNLAWLVARPTPCTWKERARDAQCKAPIYDGTPSTDPEQRACRATTRLSARSNVQSRGSAPPPARLRACRAFWPQTACSPPAQKPQKGGVHAACARERAASPADTRTRTSSLAQEWSSPASVASCLSFRCWQSRNLQGLVWFLRKPGDLLNSQECVSRKWRGKMCLFSLFLPPCRPCRPCIPAYLRGNE